MTTTYADCFPLCTILAMLFHMFERSCDIIHMSFFTFLLRWALISCVGI